MTQTERGIYLRTTAIHKTAVMSAQLKMSDHRTVCVCVCGSLGRNVCVCGCTFRWGGVECHLYVFCGLSGLCGCHDASVCHGVLQSLVPTCHATCSKSPYAPCMRSWDDVVFWFAAVCAVPTRRLYILVLVSPPLVSLLSC